MLLLQILSCVALLQFYSLFKIQASFGALVVGVIVVNTAYVIRTVTATLTHFEMALEEAAQNLGITLQGSDDGNQWSDIWVGLGMFLSPGFQINSRTSLASPFVRLKVTLANGNDEPATIGARAVLSAAINTSRL